MPSHSFHLLPAACLHPAPSFFDVFQGQTLGAFGVVSSVAIVYAVGLAIRCFPLTGRFTTAESFAKFKSRCLSTVMFLAYLIYPSTCQVVMQMFSCQELPVGVAPGDMSVAPFLRADYRIRCDSDDYRRYRAAGVFWVIVYPAGIPLLFLGLLFYYGVPQMALRKHVASQLQHAARVAMQVGVELPPLVLHAPAGAARTGATRPHAVQQQSKQEEAAERGGADEATSGCSSNIQDMRPDNIPPDFLHALARACLGVGEAERLRAEGGKAKKGVVPSAVAAAARVKRKQLRAVVEWCNSVFTPPALAWQEKKDDNEDAAAGDAKDSSMIGARRSSLANNEPDLPPAAQCAHLASAHLCCMSKPNLPAPRSLSLAATSPRTAVRSTAHAHHACPRRRMFALPSPLPEEQAMVRRLHFLVGAYRVDCWYWELTELVRKFVLVSALTLVRPGSAAQVACGLLLSLTGLVLHSRLFPYASSLDNVVGFIAQADLSLLFLCGLFLKTANQADAQSGFFAGVTAVLAISVPALPVVYILVCEIGFLFAYLFVLGDGDDEEEIVYVHADLDDADVQAIVNSAPEGSLRPGGYVAANNNEAGEDEAHVVGRAPGAGG